jgi:hypothetical protein
MYLMLAMPDALTSGIPVNGTKPAENEIKSGILPISPSGVIGARRGIYS